MIFVGIDVAKDKHDCFIISSEGEVLANVFTITNSKEGFEHLLQTINTCTGISVSKGIKRKEWVNKIKDERNGMTLMLA